MIISLKAALRLAGAVTVCVAAPLIGQTRTTMPTRQSLQSLSATAPQSATRTSSDQPAVERRSTAAAAVTFDQTTTAGTSSNRAPGYDIGQPPLGPDDGIAMASGPVMSLAEAMTLAYRGNPRLIAQRATVRSTDFQLAEARSAYGPNLSVEGAYTFTRSRAQLTSGNYLPQQGFTSTASAILNQPLFTFGRNAAAEQGAYAQIAFQRDSLRLVETNLMLNVVSSYVGVLRDASAVTIARENLALLQRQYNDNRERFRVREITSTDLQQVETRLELAQAQLLSAEGQLGISQADFFEYVGAVPGELAPPDLLNIRYTSIDGAFADADRNSPVVRAAQSREKVSRATYQAARTEWRPRVDLRGTAQYGTLSPYSDQFRSTVLTGQVVLSQPLIDSGLRRSRQDQAREANQADWRLIDAALRETHQIVSSAWNQLTSSRASLDNYRRALDAAQRAYDGARLQERAGDRTTLDVLDLARDLLNVRLGYNSSVANEYIARATLLAAAGRIEAPQVVSGLTAYDPSVHFDRVRRRSDIPLLTPALSTLDGLATGSVLTDRAIRDDAARMGVKPSLPLTAPDPVTVP
jgi:outer membrane protein